MLKQDTQMTLSMSPYSVLYDLLIEKDNFWRELNETIDFSFVYDLLKDKYSATMGRPAEEIIRMFKYLLLKTHFKVSDRGLINRTKTDLLFKYFLGYEPEDLKLIDPSLLSVFRRQRLSHQTNDDAIATTLMDTLIQKTVEIALEKGLIEVKSKLIVDSTHTNAMYQSISPREAMIKQSKKLRKSMYTLDETYKDKMPNKRETSGLVEDQVTYCKELIELAETDPRLVSVPAIEEEINYLKEMVEDSEEAIVEYSKDQDAKVGHKSADTSFFGYKSHIAMTMERIITAVSITSGEKHDGKELVKLIEKSKENGIEVEAVIGDGAYSEKDNLDYCHENDIKNVSKLSKIVTHGNRKNAEDFTYNKDAEMYVCKAGHMAIKKIKSGSKKKNEQVESYRFDVEKCRVCAYREGCYKEGAKTKSYNVKIKTPRHLEQMAYMETEAFKEMAKERYKIEAKNGELKTQYGYGKANGCGKVGMSIQGATTLFLANMKRIKKLEEEKNKKKGKENEE